ncbi:sensor histidine kinase [Streptosporangium sandarakinum]
MGKPRGLTLRGRTVRQRFTVMYAALFLTSGIALLAMTDLFAGGWRASRAAPGPPAPRPDLITLQEHVERLQAQLADVHATQSRQLLAGSLVALVVMGAVSVLLGGIVAGRVLRPLRAITSATRRISADNLHERLAVPGPADEVKDLADTVDGLLERLETSFAAQRRFVADASHELRTPLATMRASLDVAAAKPAATSQTLALTDRLRTELDRIDHLLEGLLLLARAQYGVLPGLAPVSLARLLSEAMTARSTAVTAKDLTVHADTGDGAWTRGSPVLLSRVVDNLIDNAVIHNRRGGWIRVAATTAGSSARLVVETGGAVLDQEHVARLTEPFRRLAADRTGSEAGSGLGLSIVAAVVGAHGGHLELRARPEGGLRVAVSVPSAPAPAGAAA